MTEKENAVYRVREFTRFYMSSLSLLGNSYLGSEYSATEARVLFEIYENEGCNAAYISKKMNIDKSYLSRIVKKHEKSGLLQRKVSETDLRAYHLTLNESGIAMTEDFIRKSNEQIGKQIRNLTGKDCRELTKALDTVTDMLSAMKTEE